MFHKQIGDEFSEECAVFIKNAQRVLLRNIQTQLAQPVAETILVYFFHVTMPKVPVERKCGFTNAIAE